MSKVEATVDDYLLTFQSEWERWSQYRDGAEACQLPDGWARIIRLHLLAPGVAKSMIYAALIRAAQIAMLAEHVDAQALWPYFKKVATAEVRKIQEEGNCSWGTRH